MSNHNRQILSLDVSELRALIDAEAAAAGTRPGPWVKQLIARALSAPGPELPSSQGRAAHPAANRRLQAGPVKFTARLSEGEAAALTSGAAAAGLSRAEYLARLVLGNNMQGAPAAAGLMAALTDSNHQLVALGRNLNQIARSLNAYPGRMTPADRDCILAAAEAARTHVELVAQHLGDMRATRRSKAKRAAKGV